MFCKKAHQVWSLWKILQLYTLWLATSTGLLFNRLHHSWCLKSFSSSSLSQRSFNLLIIYGSSSHLTSAHGNVRTYVGITNCLTIAGTSYKKWFKYAGIPLMKLINENALSLAKKLSMIPYQLFFTVPAVVCLV